MINVLFESSHLPQAILSINGHIDVANTTFAQLLGAERESLEGSAIRDTALLDCVPGLLDAVRAVHHTRRPAEHRAHVTGGEDAALDLVIWLTPFTGEMVHVLVRVDQPH